MITIMSQSGRTCPVLPDWVYSRGVPNRIAPYQGRSPGVDLAAEIRAEAARQRVTVTALARQVGMSTKTCSRKLQGHSGITTADLWQFADALGVPAGELIARAEASRDLAVA